MSEWDLDSMSDEQLEALAAGQMPSNVQFDSGSVDLDALSDSELEIIANTGKMPEPFSFLELGKQIGSGAIEGTAGTVGFMADVAEFANPMSVMNLNKLFSFDKTDEAMKLVEPITAAKRPEAYYRFPRKIADFVAPGAAINKVGKASKLLGKFFPSVGRGVVTDTGAAVASQLAEDTFPDSPTASILGAIFGGVGTEATIGGLSTLRRQIAGLSPDEVRDSAAYVLKSLDLGYSPAEIDDLVKSLPDDELAGFMSSAEVLESPQMAQLQEYLTQGTGPGGPKYTAMTNRRQDKRIKTLQELPEFVDGKPRQSPNIEGFGERLQMGGADEFAAQGKRAQKAWEKFPNDKPVTTSNLKRALNDKLAEKTYKVNVDGKVKERRIELKPEIQDLIDRLNEADELPTGYLQDLRSEALELKREKSFSRYQKGVLSEIESVIDKAIKSEAEQVRYLPAEDAFRAEGYDPTKKYYHGTAEDFQDYAKNKNELPLYEDVPYEGVWSVPENYKVAETYANRNEIETPHGPIYHGANVRPNYIKNGQTIKIDAQGALWNDLSLPELKFTLPDGEVIYGTKILDYFNDAEKEKFIELFGNFNDFDELESFDRLSTRKLERFLKKHVSDEFTAIEFENIIDLGGKLEGLNPQEKIKFMNKFIRDKYPEVANQVSVGGDLAYDTRIPQSIQREAEKEFYKPFKHTARVDFDTENIRSVFDPPKIEDPNALTPEEYASWRKGRDITRQRAETFKRGTAGGVLLDDRIRPKDVVRRVFKGDKKSIEELRAAIGNNPELMEDFKAAIVDMIPKNKNGHYTTGAFNKFLQQNKNAIEELYGTEGLKRFNRVLEDLQSGSPESIGDMANLSSKGQSATLPKMRTAGAISDLIASRGNTRIPFMGQFFDDLTQGAKESSKEAIESMLIEAAFDPAKLSELLKAPTEQRVRTILGDLGLMAQRAGVAAARGGIFGGINSGDRRTERVLDKVFRMQGTKNETKSTTDIFRKPGGSSEPAASDKQKKTESSPINKISTSGLDLIKKHEGLRLKPYKDTGGVQTVGYGNTRDASGPITKDKAESLLKKDVKIAASAVKDSVQIELSQNEFDALTSLAFNIGENAFRNSTLVDKLNQGDKEGAAEEFARWVYDNGKVIPGLVKRRKNEAELFMGA